MHYINHLQQVFLENRDAKAANSMAEYMKNKFEFMGVAGPVRKDLCKGVYAEYGLPEDGFQIARGLFGLPQREFHYVAQELLMKCKMQWKEHHIEDIEWFIVTNSWWDTVDSLASNVVGEYFKKWPEGMHEVMNEWNKSDNIWLVRSSIIFQLKYKNNVDSKLLSKCILPHIAEKEFFIKKAIGWALRQYSRYDESWVLDFVNNTDLSSLSRKEALRLIKDKRI